MPRRLGAVGGVDGVLPLTDHDGAVLVGGTDALAATRIRTTKSGTVVPDALGPAGMVPAPAMTLVSLQDQLVSGPMTGRVGRWPGILAGVERRVDLDQVAGLISRHAVAWEPAGLVVGALTWRGVGVPWPYPLKADRGEVTDPDSVGVAVHKQEQEGRLVVFRGGWADLEYWTGRRSDEPVLEAPGTGDPMSIPDIERLLDRFAGLFR